MNSKIEALTNVTDLEKLVLTTLVGLLYAEAGYSDVTVPSISKGCGVSPYSVKGVIGSLVKKGLVEIYTWEANDVSRNFICLRVEHYGLHPEWSDSETQNRFWVSPNRV